MVLFAHLRSAPRTEHLLAPSASKTCRRNSSCIVPGRNIGKVTKTRVSELPYLFRGQRLASEVIATRREAALDKAGVHPHEVLHLVRVSVNAQGPTRGIG